MLTRKSIISKSILLVFYPWSISAISFYKFPSSNQPPCKVLMKAHTSFGCISYLSPSRSSQSVSLTRTIIPGLTVPAWINISRFSFKWWLARVSMTVYRVCGLSPSLTASSSNSMVLFPSKSNSIPPENSTFIFICGCNKCAIKLMIYLVYIWID